MGVIRVNSGMLITNDQRVDAKIQMLLSEGALWEYISLLLEKDVKGAAHVEVDRLEGKIDELSLAIKNMNSSFRYLQTNPQVNPNPGIATSPSVDKPKPKPKKPNTVKSKNVTKNNSFLAAVSKAKTFR